MQQDIHLTYLASSISELKGVFVLLQRCRDHAILQLFCVIVPAKNP